MSHLSPMPLPPTTSTFHTLPIASRYGRAYWRGWHYFLHTPGWTHCPLYKALRSRRFRHAFWAGYDMAKQAELHHAAISHHPVDIRYHPGEELY